MYYSGNAWFTAYEVLSNVNAAFTHLFINWNVTDKMAKHEMLKFFKVSSKKRSNNNVY